MAPRDSDDSYTVDEKAHSTPQPQAEHEPEVQGGETSKFPSEQWLKYLEEMGDRDKEIIERFTKEADTTLVFAGLFTAVITVSLVESYKWLSPNPGDETVKLLAQLVNISSGIPIESTSAGSNQPFKPSTSALMVNATWFCSVVLCLGCSVFATLIQQQSRRSSLFLVPPPSPQS
ncbi:hypothetical protein H4582DRAFT_1841679 [Lactarius indigo]|nr:hypothetical protein H4582DRAFT_1841679 [Lactarius indigo]